MQSQGSAVVEIHAEPNRRVHAPFEVRAANFPQSPAAPELARVTVTVSLTRDDVLAALSRWDGATYAEISDDATALEMIAEAVVNAGLLELARDRDVAVPRMERTDAAWMRFCRARLADLFGPPAPVCMSAAGVPVFAGH